MRGKQQSSKINRKSVRSCSPDIYETQTGSLLLRHRKFYSVLCETWKGVLEILSSSVSFSKLFTNFKYRSNNEVKTSEVLRCGHILICVFSDDVNCTQKAYKAV